MGNDRQCTMMMQGYMFVERDDEDLALAGSEGVVVGAVLRTPSGAAPWIVLHHEIADAGVCAWPGRLLRAEVVELAAEGMAELPTEWPVGYVRCCAVRIVEELEAWRVFGAHGEGVVEVLEVARRLSLEQAQRLADHDAPEASASHVAAWEQWRAREARERGGAPVNMGFWAINNELQTRAEAVSGTAGVAIDEEGESHLVEPWNAALSALLHAAMDLGAPHLVSSEDRALLLRGWQSLALDARASSH